MMSDGNSLARRPAFLKAILDILSENEGEMRARVLLQDIEKRLKPTSFEASLTDKAGYPRWWAAIQFDSVRLVKAGWIRKRRGVWFLTDEGGEAQKLPVDELDKRSWLLYKKWQEASDDSGSTTLTETAIPHDELVSQVTFEQAEEIARSGIEDHIAEMGPYDFQDLVAALLRGMAYHTPFIAPPGKDGGIDVLAFKDPLGAVPPRIKVQVKHRANTKVTVKEVRELKSLLNKDGDTGLIVSSGGFTSDAIAEVRHSVIHLETIGLDRLVELWEEYYDDLEEADKELMPLRRIAFLAPTDP